MKKWILATSLVAAAPSAMALPFIDFEVGGGMTIPTLNDGQFGDEYSLTSSGGSEANLDLSAENGFYAGGRLGVPILPDVKLRYERLMMTNSNFEQEFEAFGQTFDAEGEIELDMSYLDTALVYGVPNLVPGLDYYFDFGLNLRWMLGGVAAEVSDDDGNTERQSADFPGVPIPAGHLAAGVTIPTVNVEVSGELNTLPIDGLAFNDWHLKARWYAPLPTNVIARLGLEAGYRSWTVNIDGNDTGLIDDDIQLDFDTSGFFVGTAIRF